MAGTDLPILSDLLLFKCKMSFEIFKVSLELPCIKSSSERVEKKKTSAPVRTPERIKARR
jgi:hypothetical protein